jgi:hypothetical protein
MTAKAVIEKSLLNVVIKFVLLLFPSAAVGVYLRRGARAKKQARKDIKKSGMEGRSAD